MRRRITTILMLLSATVLLAPATADAKPRKRAKAAKPKVTRVLPMRVRVGGRLVIRGRGFSRRRMRNTVIFRGHHRRTVLAKPRRARRRALLLVVPPRVARLLRVRKSRQRPTRLKLRVLTRRGRRGRSFSRFTRRRLSPVVLGTRVSRGGEGGDGGGDGGGGGGAQGGGEVVEPVCEDDADHDDDLLPNDLEAQLGTDPCLADTDGDSMIDGWEYYAARDLSVKAVPFPGRRPFPNALDPSDGGQGASSAWDFDGDGLTTLEEYRAWRFTGSSFDPAKSGGLDGESPLGYSDGTKLSRASEVPPVPAWRGPAYGLPAPAEPFPATYDLNQDAPWRDDERDADRDGLSNFLEAARGPRTNDWWGGYWSSFDPPVKPWPETYYGHFDQRPFAELDLADPDVDGDTLLDGEDDQDSDDYTNITELYEVVYDLDGDGQLGGLPSIDIGGTSFVINGMNPCAPDVESRTCPDYAPQG